MNYSAWTAAVCTLLEYQIVDPASVTPTDVDAYNDIYPRAIDYAELRIQRDLDFIATTQGQTGTFVAGARKPPLPVSALGPFVVVQTVQLIIGGERQPPLEPITREMMDYFWPENDSVAVGANPVQWCPNDSVSIIIGPAPYQDTNYNIVGTVRFAPLSAANPTNFLTLYLPDLYLAASMIFFTGFQRDFGSQADDPKMAQSWENQYQQLLQPAQTEEARKRYAGMLAHASAPAPVTG